MIRGKKARKKTEADQIEAVFRKLSRLTNVFLHETMVGKEELDELNYESQGILVQVVLCRVVSCRPRRVVSCRIVVCS